MIETMLDHFARQLPDIDPNRPDQAHPATGATEIGR